MINVCILVLITMTFDIFDVMIAYTDVSLSGHMHLHTVVLPAKLINQFEWLQES